METASPPFEPAGRRQLPIIALLVISGLILVLLPLLVSTYIQNLMSKILIFTLFAMSLDLLMGYADLPSLGHAAYFGTAGYVTAILTLNYQVASFWLIASVALLAAVVVACLFGLIALRVSGIYFLLITFALCQLLFWVAWLWRSVTGGDDGLGGIMVLNLGFPVDWNPLLFYYFVFIIFAICYFIMKRLVSSPFGRVLRGIAGNESRMRALGYNTWAFKYTIFIISALFAGVAGILYVYFNEYVGPHALGIHLSGLGMFIVILGGAATLIGAFLGTLIILTIEHLSSIYFPERWPLALGATFVITAMYIRGGIAPHLFRLWDKVGEKLWKR